MKVQLQRTWSIQRRRRNGAQARIWLGVARLIFLLALLGVVRADELTTSSPSMVKAAY